MNEKPGYSLKKTELIGLEAIQDLIELVLWTLFVRGERIVSLLIVSDSENGKTEPTRCLNCHQITDQSYYESHEGLCMNCYYLAMAAESNKEQRRSGTFGSDRAGTW
jgi:hypothetical protein